MNQGLYTPHLINAMRHGASFSEGFRAGTSLREVIRRLGKKGAGL